MKTILTQQPGFSIKVPETYRLDETQNPNTDATSTWFRDDGLALLAVDRQALAGSRLESLQKKGNKRYLYSVSAELERDLGARLEVFGHFESEFIKLGGQDAVVATFNTRHEGTNYKSYILVTVQLGEPAHEVMVDLRIPSSEAEGDAVWAELLKSWKWGDPTEEKKPEGEKKVAKSDEHH